VSKVVAFASKHQLEVTVKGGGHSTGGTSATSGGLVIDLAKMRRVTVDKGKKIIVAQGGALWCDVDEAAAEHGLATVGGTVNHTGIGGLTLGGGYGWLSGLYGAVVDNLVGATVVIANGQILNTSETENSELFWAIRGAGHNFGVTVEFRYKAHDQPSLVYAGMLVFTPDKLEGIIDVLNERHVSADPRAAFQFAFAVPPGAPGPLIIVVCFYNGDETAALEYLAPVLELGPVSNDLRTIPYVQMNGLLNDMVKPGGRKAFKGGTFAPHVRKEFARWLFNEYISKVTQEPDLARSFLSIEFYSTAKIAEVPIEAMAFPTRGRYHAGVMALMWSDPTRDDDFRSWGRFLRRKCQEEIHQVESQLNSETVPEYANYSEREFLYMEVG
jgi:FAD/FMN-containing dehydrogenase